MSDKHVKKKPFQKFKGPPRDGFNLICAKNLIQPSEVSY